MTPSNCPEGITQCELDCPRYGRDCDGDEVVYVTGGVGDVPADAPTTDWFSPLSHDTQFLINKYALLAGWSMGLLWLMWQTGWTGPDPELEARHLIDEHYRQQAMRGHTNETD